MTKRRSAFMTKEVWLGVVIFIAFVLAVIVIGFIVMDTPEIHYRSYEPITEEGVVEYIREEVFRRTGDDVEVKVVGKEPIEGCVKRLDGCSRYEAIADVYEYELQVANEDDFSVRATVTFSDSYITDGGVVTGRRVDCKDYYAVSFKDKIRDELATKLGDARYYIYDSANIVYAYIRSDDYKMLDGVFTGIHEINEKFNSDRVADFDIFVIGNDKYFDSINFGEVRPLIGDLDTVRWDSGYSREVMESGNPGGYDSMIFDYSSFRCYEAECSIMSGYPAKY